MVHTSIDGAFPLVKAGSLMLGYLHPTRLFSSFFFFFPQTTGLWNLVRLRDYGEQEIDTTFTF